VVADLLEQCAENEGPTAEARQQLCDELRRATEALNTATTPFAARRMDSRVRQALAGQRIEQVAA
jgi:molecular chaperone HscA